MARALHGEIAALAQKDGFREEYFFKLLTLTVPGLNYRLAFTPEQAAAHLRDSFKKLIDNLRERHGNFHYLRVMEAQKDGFPHYHVLLVGRPIASYGILKEIRDLWCGVYHMGFVKLNTIKGGGGIEKAIKYVLKYLFKSPTVYKSFRLFTSSRKAIDPPFKPVNKYVWYSIDWARFRGISYEQMEWMAAQETASTIDRSVVDLWDWSPKLAAEVINLQMELKGMHRPEGCPF